MHNLMTDKRTNEISFVNNVKNVKDRAWHHLGQEVTEAMTSKEVITKAHLDYNVIKTRVKTNYEGVDIEIPNRMSTINEVNKKVLGLVTDTYQVVQNDEAFLFFDSIVGEGKAIFETAGALGNGERIFISAKLPDYIKIDSKDVLEKYLFLTNSHDGSGAIIAAFTPIRIVCNNTLNAALKNCSNRVYFKHTKNVSENLSRAMQIMKMSNTMTEEFGQACVQMSKVKITDKQLLEYIAAVMSNDEKIISQKDFETEYSTRNINIAQQIFEYGTTNDTQLMVSTKGTLFGAYNSITGYFQNMKGWKTPEEKLDALILSDKGTARNKTQKAFNMALSML